MICTMLHCVKPVSLDRWRIGAALFLGPKIWVPPPPEKKLLAAKIENWRKIQSIGAINFEKIVWGRPTNFGTYIVQVPILPIMCESFTAIGRGSSQVYLCKMP